MQQIHNGTQKTVTLEIYNNGFLSDADGSVVVNITDADTGVSLVSSASAVSDSSTGGYYYSITPDVTQLNRVIKVKWSYAIDGDATSQSQLLPSQRDKQVS